MNAVDAPPISGAEGAGRTLGGTFAQQPSRGDLKVSLPGLVILNSKPGGGKSHASRYIMSENRGLFAHGIAFSKSAFNEGNLDFVPDYGGDPRYLNFRHLRYDGTVLREFLAGQARYPVDKRPLGFVIIDDDISEPGMFEDEVMIDLASMYRQYNVFALVCTQYINKISTTFRECATQVGLFRMDSKRAIEAAYESYGQDFEDEKSFKRFLQTSTTPSSAHYMCWKDKEGGAPWQVVRAPAVIPPFRIEYGLRPKSSDRRRKGGGKKKKRKKLSEERRPNPIGSDFAALGLATEARVQAGLRSCHGGQD